MSTFAAGLEGTRERNVAGVVPFRMLPTSELAYKAPRSSGTMRKRVAALVAFVFVLQLSLTAEGAVVTISFCTS